MGPPKIARQPYKEENVIKFQVQGTKPMKYLWFKDDQELCDGDDYKGSTTSELCIMRSSQQLVQGKFKCQVTNMYGLLEIQYGRS